MYTDHCLEAGDLDWGIVGASLQSSSTRDALRQQDYLYTVDARGNEACELKVGGAISHVLHAPTESEALLLAMSDERVRIVTMTITEKGYTADVATGSLDQEDPNVQHDLMASGPPRTALGYLAEALRRRRFAGIRPFTILSCDNLPKNGRILKEALSEFAYLREASLGRYVSEEVACPCTMVDRIVPSTTAEDRRSVEQRTGLYDASPVITELFTQWVIEDHCTAGRPEWESAGAEIVKDVHPYERMKLRLLNGAHTFLASAGMLLGLETVAQASADATLSAFLREFWREGFSTLPVELDPDRYCRRLELRFRNPSLQHRLAQISRDSSLKVPQRILAPLLERRLQGLPSPALLFALGVWIRFTLGFTETGGVYSLDDPAAKKWSSFGAPTTVSQDIIGHLVQDRLGALGVAGAVRDPLLDELTLIVNEILRVGVRAAISRHAGTSA